MRQILKDLGGLDTVPRYIDHGLHEGREYLIMDLLGGEDMSNLRDRARRQCGVRLVPLPVTIFCMKQMLLCLKDLHGRGYIHRDVKPANFVRKSKDSTSFCVIDFGLTKQYLNKNGEIIPKRDKVEFRGTTMYASPRTIAKEEQSPRDDLYSLAFVLCDFLCGTLPWAEASRDKNKPEVARLKKLYVMENPGLLAKYVCDTAKTEATRAYKYRQSRDSPVNRGGEALEWPFDEEFDPCPEGAVKALVCLFKYLSGLKYEDSSPDYDYITDLLDTMQSTFRTNAGVCAEDGTMQSPGNLAYTCGGCFSWTRGQATTPSMGSRLVGSDIDVHEAIRVKAGHLQTCFEEAIGANGIRVSGLSNSITKTALPISQLIAVPQRLKRSWLSLQHDLMSVRNTSVIHSSTISLLLDLARSADFFIGGVSQSGTHQSRRRCQAETVMFIMPTKIQDVHRDHRHVHLSRRRKEIAKNGKN